MSQFAQVDIGICEQRFRIQKRVLKNKTLITPRDLRYNLISWFSCYFLGLLSVSIKPDGRFLGEDFIIGTNESIAVEQSVSCCTTGVDITAVDVRGNTATCRADQCNLRNCRKNTNALLIKTIDLFSTDSIYLSSGDVAAITLGVILLILLLIIIILAICRCCRRRKERSIKTAPIPRSKKDQAWLARFSPKRSKPKDLSITVTTVGDN